MNPDKSKVAKPRMIRLTIMVEYRKENGDVMNEIAWIAENQMQRIVGFKLLKMCDETVHAIETYGSVPPKEPRADRSAK